MVDNIQHFLTWGPLCPFNPFAPAIPCMPFIPCEWRCFECWETLQSTTCPPESQRANYLVSSKSLQNKFKSLWNPPCREITMLGLQEELETNNEAFWFLNFSTLMDIIFALIPWRLSENKTGWSSGIYRKTWKPLSSWWTLRTCDTLKERK